MGRPNQNSKWKAGQQPDPVFVNAEPVKKTVKETAPKTDYIAPTIEDETVEVVDVKKFNKIKKNED
jgi:hypothetical protein